MAIRHFFVFSYVILIHAHEHTAHLPQQPTNHLDVDALDWLAEFLRPGNRENKDLTMLLVTHDRFFLERVCSESKRLFCVFVFVGCNGEVVFVILDVCGQC